MLKAKNTLANSKMLTTAKKFLPKLVSRGYLGHVPVIVSHPALKIVQFATKTHGAMGKRIQ